MWYNTGINSNYIYMGYSSTFAFLIVALLGWLGVGQLVSEKEVAVIIDNILQIAGILGGLWARYKQGNVNVLGFRK